MEFMSRIAVVGAGYWGRNLVRNLAEMDELRVICDRSPEVRHRMSERYPAVSITEDFDAVLNDPGVEGVMVVVPSSLHHEIARRCLMAGKHTYVEKPIALSVADAENLCRIADEKGLVLMVGHLLLFHPCIRWIRQFIAKGGIGDTLYMNCERVNLGKVRADENAMWSLAPHDVSVALYLMDSLPSHVAAQGLCYLQKETGLEDVVFMTLRFPGERAAQIHVSWLDPNKKRQLTVIGNRKMVTFDDMQPAEKVRVYDKGIDLIEPDDIPYPSYSELLTMRQGDITIPHIRMREPLRALCEHFIECIETNREPMTSGRNGVEVLKVLQAAQQSLQTDGVPVALTPHPGGRRRENM